MVENVNVRGEAIIVFGKFLMDFKYNLGVKIKIDASPIPLFFGIRPESMIQREQKHTNWKLFPRYPPDKYVKIMSQESHSSRILNNKNKIVTMYVNVNVLSFSKSFVTK